MCERPRDTRHPGIALLLAVLAAALAGTAAASTSPAPPASGETALLFDAPDLTGTTVDLHALLKGQVGLVAMWATWCQPCVEEIPRLREIARTYRDKGLVVVGVGLGRGGDTPPKQRQVAARQLVNYLLVFDQDGEYEKGYGLSSLPYTVLVGADGRIRWQGNVLPDDLDARIQATLAESPGRQGG